MQGGKQGRWPPCHPCCGPLTALLFPLQPLKSLQISFPVPRLLHTPCCWSCRGQSQWWSLQGPGAASPETHLPSQELAAAAGNTAPRVVRGSLPEGCWAGFASPGLRMLFAPSLPGKPAFGWPAPLAAHFPSSAVGKSSCSLHLPSQARVPGCLVPGRCPAAGEASSPSFPLGRSRCLPDFPPLSCCGSQGGRRRARPEDCCLPTRLPGTGPSCTAGCPICACIPDSHSEVVASTNPQPRVDRRKCRLLGPSPLSPFVPEAQNLMC